MKRGCDRGRSRPGVSADGLGSGDSVPATRLSRGPCGSWCPTCTTLRDMGHAGRSPTWTCPHCTEDGWDLGEPRPPGGRLLRVLVPENLSSVQTTSSLPPGLRGQVQRVPGVLSGLPARSRAWASVSLAGLAVSGDGASLWAGEPSLGQLAKPAGGPRATSSRGRRGGEESCSHLAAQPQVSRPQPVPGLPVTLRVLPRSRPTGGRRRQGRSAWSRAGADVL